MSEATPLPSPKPPDTPSLPPMTTALNMLNRHVLSRGDLRKKDSASATFQLIFCNILFIHWLSAASQLLTKWNIWSSLSMPCRNWRNCIHLPSKMTIMRIRLQAFFPSSVDICGGGRYNGISGVQARGKRTSFISVLPFLF